MNNLAIDQLYSCAARIIKSLDTDLSQQEMSAACRKDAVAMLHKLANLLLQISKLREIDQERSENVGEEDHVIIQEFLRKYQHPLKRGKQ
jgi:hypothetical protein